MTNRSKLKWRWYLLILILYNFFMPVKPTSPFFTEFIVSYGTYGFLTYFKEYPLTFFVMPLLIFLIARFVIFLIQWSKEGSK